MPKRTAEIPESLKDNEILDRKEIGEPDNPNVPYQAVPLLVDIHDTPELGKNWWIEDTPLQEGLVDKFIVWVW